MFTKPLHSIKVYLKYTDYKFYYSFKYSSEDIIYYPWIVCDIRGNTLCFCFFTETNASAIKFYYNTFIFQLLIQIRVIELGASPRKHWREGEQITGNKCEQTLVAQTGLVTCLQVAHNMQAISSEQGEDLKSPQAWGGGEVTVLYTQTPWKKTSSIHKVLYY